jgi:peptide/nickel transport system substrate-binding protein
VLEFRLLGSLEAYSDGSPVTPNRPKQKALLALLLLDRGTVISTDRLIDRLWGERPPPTARDALQNYVAQLRKALGPDAVITRAPGYLLDVDAEQVDLGRFERLTAAAKEIPDPAGRVQLLDEALDLWRGPALADLEGEDFAPAESARLEELRRAAVEDRLDAELRLGRHAQLVPELEQLVRDDPLRERLRGLLMLALYRSGRQADALAVYADTRRTLVDELGIEPSRSLQQLEQAILRQDPALDPPRPDPQAEREPVEPRRFARRHRLAGLVALGLALAAGAAAAGVAYWLGPPHSVGIDSTSLGAFDSDGNLLGRAPVGGTPSALAIGDDGSVWAAEFDRSTVVRVDPARFVTRQTIDVGAGPSAVAVGGGAVWVANRLDGTVSRIDPATNRETAHLAPGGAPVALAYSDGSLWVADAADRSVERLDPATGRTLATIALDGTPNGIAGGAGAVWVTSPDGPAVYRIDPAANAVVRSIAVGAGAGAIAVRGRTLWVANADDSTLSRIDARTNRVTATTVVAARPVGVVASPSAVWVTSADGARLQQIDPVAAQVVLSIRISNAPGPIVSRNGMLWVATSIPASRHRGGTLHVLVGRDLPALDPATGSTAEAWQLESLTGDGLVGFARVGGPESTVIVPDLARSIPTATDGGTTYHFVLRPGLEYADGEPVRATDVRRTLERVFRLHSNGAPLYADLVGGNACLAAPTHCSLSRGVVANDRTGMVAIRVVRPDPELLSTLSLPYAHLVPSGTPDRPPPDQPPTGTGPYRLTHVETTGGATAFARLERNSRFRVWSPSAQPDGFPNTIEVRVLDPASAADALVQGKADIAAAQDIGRSRLAELSRGAPAQLHTAAAAQVSYAVLDTRVPPFDNADARRALSFAVDRNAAAVLAGPRNLTAPACDVLARGLQGSKPYCPYTLDPGAGRWIGPDLGRAEELVARSGTRGMRVAVNPSPGQTTEAGLLARTLRELGYRASVSKSHTGRPQVRLTSSGSNYPSTSAYFEDLLRCGQADAPLCDRGDESLFRSAESDESSDPSEAAATWSRLDQRVSSEAAVVPLFTVKAAQVTSARVGNFQNHLVLGVLLDQLWVKG